MSNDKDKLLQIMASLESDYAHGKISKEKYVYFRSKYEDKLNALDAREATNRIRILGTAPMNGPKYGIIFVTPMIMAMSKALIPKFLRPHHCIIHIAT